MADEQEDMIDRYLDKGRVFKPYDDGVKCIAGVAIFSYSDGLRPVIFEIEAAL